MVGAAAVLGMGAACTVALGGLVTGALGMGAASGSVPLGQEPPAMSPDSGWFMPMALRVVRGFEAPDRTYGPGHRGVDLAARADDPVRAIGAGAVSFVGDVAGRPVITVDHGELQSTYEAVDAVVRVGDAVFGGELIGLVASGGHCDGACMHLGLRRAGDGAGAPAYLDPLAVLTPRPLVLKQPSPWPQSAIGPG